VQLPGHGTWTARVNASLWSFVLPTGPWEYPATRRFHPPAARRPRPRPTLRSTPLAAACLPHVHPLLFVAATQPPLLPQLAFLTWPGRRCHHPPPLPLPAAPSLPWLPSPARAAAASIPLFPFGRPRALLSGTSSPPSCSRCPAVAAAGFRCTTVCHRRPAPPLLPSRPRRRAPALGCPPRRFNGCFHSLMPTAQRRGDSRCRHRHRSRAASTTSGLRHGWPYLPPPGAVACPP